MVGPAVKREAVAYLRTACGLSERQACRIVGADRKMVRYQAQRAPDTVLRGRLRELANERRRFGYRRLFVLLRREGEHHSPFGPAPLQRLQPYYGPFCPCAPHRYSGPLGGFPIGRLP
jgi:hypothetical protein